MTGHGAAPAALWQEIAPSLGRIGESYGTQAIANWQAGDGSSRVLVDTTRAASLWRVSVFGAVRLVVSWGTGAGNRIENAAAPLVASFPGSVCIEAIPVNPAVPTSARATITPATGAGVASFRALTTAGSVFPPFTTRVQALTACTVTVEGVAVGLAAGAQMAVTDGAILTAGTALALLEP